MRTVVRVLKEEGSISVSDKQFLEYHGIDRGTAAKIMWANGWVILKPRATYPARMVDDNYGRPAWDYPLYDKVDMGSTYKCADDGAVKGEC